MKHLCVVSDYNFLPKGLTLYESLLKNSEDFVLHYLCFDEKSYTKLLEYESDSLRVYSDESFLENDEVLNLLKTSDRKYYSYTLASYFSHQLMGELDAPITYIDADIFFHQDIGVIFEEMGEKEVGIFRHRQYDPRYPNGNGWFNVGVVHFKNTVAGRHVLSWWSDAVLYRKYPELATCGDQRYLDAFLELDEAKLFIDGTIGHGAPWQWMLYDFSTYEDDGCITWGGQRQKLVFSHFSQFEYSLKDNSYTPSTTHYCFTPLDMYSSIPQLKSIHDDYFGQIKRAHKEYNL